MSEHPAAGFDVYEVNVVAADHQVRHSDAGESNPPFTGLQDCPKSWLRVGDWRHANLWSVIAKPPRYDPRRCAEGETLSRLNDPQFHRQPHRAERRVSAELGE